MNVFVSPSRDEHGKFKGIVQAFPNIWKGTVLDVGCRSGNLKQALPNGNAGYIGFDLVPPANILGNLETGLPFEPKSFDTVVALDSLEHTDRIHQTFTELCRVAKNYVLIALPNAYELRARLKFLMGQRLSGKYGLPVNPPSDRHRWFFSFQEAQTFTNEIGKQLGFHIEAEGCFVGPRRGTAGIREFVSVFPNLLSPSYAAVLRRERS